ncbi:hypothetical protein ED388_02185 [Muribaculaceae bacterium Isolate-007 (NCI)]|uniref:hypothetical protein n=1 Tax=Muribaculaceae TaxID=2005473 RepID=UPI000F47FA3B|nr:hypothetical protein [Muribaculum intestinale]ROT08564.1 hypothetical protein EEL42_05385 [Muribaculaceae bacterium Isolate-100 (HZI)]RXE66939.1 hypothetical protein ED388_02185 [Muribaculaceae bacterium Isolate-007 (NCI)]
MSKEKITKTDIKWTIENCLRSAIERAAISKPLSVEMVDKAFEGSELVYNFDPDTTNLTIMVDSHGRIECQPDGYYRYRYHICPMMTYDGASFSYDSSFGYFFDSYQLPSMVILFRHLVDEMRGITKQYNKRQKKSLAANVLRPLVRTLLRKERITNVKYNFTDEPSDDPKIYKEYHKIFRLSSKLSADNYEQQVKSFSEVARMMEELMDRDDAKELLNEIQAFETDEKYNTVQPCPIQEISPEMRYCDDINLMSLDDCPEMSEKIADFCAVLDSLKYNYGWIDNRLCVQLNNHVCILMEISKAWGSGYNVYPVFHELVDSNIVYKPSISLGCIGNDGVLDLLRKIAERIPPFELAEIRLSTTIYKDLISLIINHSLTLPYFINDDLYIGSNSHGCFLGFKWYILSIVEYLNSNTDFYKRLCKILGNVFHSADMNVDFIKSYR